MVDRALQEKQQKIVQAEGEATAAQMLGEAISKNPGYLKLRKLRASGNIAKTVSVAREILPNFTTYCISLSRLTGSNPALVLVLRSGCPK